MSLTQLFATADRLPVRAASSRGVVAVMVLLAAAPGTLVGQTVVALEYSPDVLVGPLGVEDHGLALTDLLSPPTLGPTLGPLPPESDLVAYHRDLVSGTHYFSLDTTVTLQGNVVIEPRDVAIWNGSTYSIDFDGSTRGVAAGASIDAITVRATDLVLSFDVTVEVPGLGIADDGDLVVWPNSGVPTFLFRADQNGLATTLDVDAAHLIDDDRLLLSLSGDGTTPGGSPIAFNAATVLEYSLVGGDWSVFFDPRQDTSWRAVDLDALFAVAETPPQSTLFADGFESGDTSLWSQSAGEV